MGLLVPPPNETFSLSDQSGQGKIIALYTIAEIMCHVPKPTFSTAPRAFASQLTVNDDNFACPLPINSTQSLAIMIHYALLFVLDNHP